MPVKGEIHVCISSASAGATVRWLQKECLPHLRGRTDTVLTLGYNVETVRQLERLAVILSKAAKRKRFDCSSFSVNIPRPLVEGFVNIAEYRSLSPVVATMLTAMRTAVKRSRGRPRLSESHREERFALNYGIDERHRRRLKQKKLFDEQWSEWFSEVNRRGETILTTSLPSPKI